MYLQVRKRKNLKTFKFREVGTIKLIGSNKKNLKEINCNDLFIRNCKKVFIYPKTFTTLDKKTLRSYIKARNIKGTVEYTTFKKVGK